MISRFTTILAGVIFLSFILLGSLQTFWEYERFTNELDRFSEKVALAQRQTLSVEVERTIEYLESLRHQVEDMARRRLEERVYRAQSSLDNLKRSHGDILDDKTLQEVFFATLRTQRFYDKGYYFISDFNGISLLNPNRSELEGSSLLGLTDSRGLKLASTFIRIAKEHGEGFLRYYFRKPGESKEKDFPKLAFVKRLMPYEMYIGTGVYLDDLESEVQDSIADYIEKYRFGYNSSGYIFLIKINDLNGGEHFGTMYANANRPDLIGKTISDSETDAHGKFFRREFLKGLREKGECYVRYWYKRFNRPEPEPKLTFFKHYKAADLIVAAGSYLPDNEQLVAQRREVLTTKLRHDLLSVLIVLALISLVMLLLVRWWTNKSGREFDRFRNFFSSAAIQGVKLREGEFSFPEMRVLAREANLMLDKRNKLDKKLRESENKFRSMMEAMSDPVYICSSDYRVEYMNPATIKWVGREALGALCYQALHGLDEPCQWCLKKGGLHGTCFELDIVSPKDNHSYHLSYSPVINEDNSISELIVCRDTTEVKRLEAQLSQTQKMESIGNLAGGIAHDFNNMLTVINIYSEAAQKGLEEGCALWVNIEQIRKAGERAANLTRQLLAFSRKQTIMPKSVNINKVITDLGKMLNRLISADISLETRLDEAVGMIYADPGQLDQIIINLVVNAQDAIKKRPDSGEKTIRISTSQVFLDDDYVAFHHGSCSGWHLLLEVEDSGCGMSAEVRSRIFEPFYTTKDIGEGTGMGLATVYGIVKQNRSSIYVYSEPGAGTTFKIYWPVVALEASEVEIVVPEEGEPGGNEVILLVEDNEQVRKIISSQLREAGYTIIEAENGLEALKKANIYPGEIDILFTDLVMPVMGGKELSGKINNIYPGIPVLFVSGYTDSEIHRDIINLDKGNFINKPYSAQDIMCKIRLLLDSKNNLKSL